MVSEEDREALRAYMPDVLTMRLGITDLGRSFSCPSPAHDDRDPSAHYYGNDFSVHCFGCGKTWDVFSLIGELDGIESFADQAQAVADAVGYRLGEGGTTRPKKKPVATLRPLFDEPREAGAADCFEAVCKARDALYAPGNEVGRRYLRWRGLDDVDIARFGLGFTSNPREILPQFAVYEPEALGFIVIPFFVDESFSAVNYCMVRTISRGEIRNKEWRPKRIASPLWNEWMLSAGVDVLYVTEGLIDAMALSKLLEAPHVMALGGIANAKRFSQVLYRVPKEKRPSKIIVCMDEDTEGRKTSAKMCADLDKLGVPHAVLPAYPDGAKDADEWLMNGRGREWSFWTEPGANGLPMFVTRWS